MCLVCHIFTIYLIFLFRIMLPSFDNLTARTATLEYASCILNGYVSQEGPQVVPLPNWWGNDSAFSYAACQFKALELEGIGINEKRMNGFFPEHLNFSLEEIQFPDSSVPEETVRAYLDIKGFVERPSEVACVIARGDTLIELFHVLLSTKGVTYAEETARRHSHGILVRPTPVISKAAAVDNLRKKMADHQVEEILYYNAACVNLLPGTTRMFNQIRLLPWEYRPGHYSHILARLYKKGQAYGLAPMYCTSFNHSLYEGPQYHPRTLSQINKAKHGYQCALADAIELFKYHSSPSITRKEFGLDY